jgi:hypothetical protein
MEGKPGPSGSTDANVEAVKQALEKAGIVFLGAKENRDAGPGVRLKK